MQQTAHSITNEVRATLEVLAREALSYGDSVNAYDLAMVARHEVAVRVQITDAGDVLRDFWRRGLATRKQSTNSAPLSFVYFATDEQRAKLIGC